MTSGETELPEITQIQRLEIKPGDRLIFRVDDPRVTQADADYLHGILRRSLSLDDVPFIVTGPVAAEIITPDAGFAEDIVRILKLRAKRLGFHTVTDMLNSH